ncbi:hypothetical protein KUTeg_009360 [Tegillarca granosa]|uniref:Uncharacterized protein n=1 Tax=Tegillarca granosa TaxID=220873 RepID=A0ABQ9F6T7_TEGGR|nr:hypothetical protein KUTeg_009360 [Tegillarca granosa]
MAGDKVFVYSNQQLQSPRGITVDSYGNVFICDSGSNNIHIVSEDGKQSVVIPSNSFGSVTKPYSIAINSSGNKLFLASYEESDPIEIYKIFLRFKEFSLLAKNSMINSLFVSLQNSVRLYNEN